MSSLRGRSHAVRRRSRLAAASVGRSEIGNLTVIVGTGRSGTNWLGQILATAPQVHTTIEQQPVFGWVTRAATDPSSSTDLIPRIVDHYEAERKLCSPRHLVDKSHPALFLADALARAIPEIRFLAIEREVEAVVASMLAHPGVIRWIKTWRDAPVPNPFLGTTADNLDWYESTGDAGRCALRWKSSAVEISRLLTCHPDRSMLIGYESLHERPTVEVDDLCDFLEVDRGSIAAPYAKRDSLHAWRDALSASDAREIQDALSIPVR